MVNAVCPPISKPGDGPAVLPEKDNKAPQRQVNLFSAPDSVRFPDIENGKVRTGQFLDAFRYLINVYDLIGPVFQQAAKLDIVHHERLRKIYDKDPTTNKYLEDLLINGIKTGRRGGAIYLCYILRTMKLLNTILQNAYMAHEKGEPINVNALSYDSYKLHIQKYQNFVNRQLFKTALLHILPGTDAFLKCLNFGKPVDSVKVVLDDAKAHMSNIRPLVEHLETFYVQNDLSLDC